MNAIKFRSLLVDGLRVLAIFLMVIYHLTYDLCQMGVVTSINILKDPFWFYLPRFIVALFLLCLGSSLVYVHGERILWKIFWKRLFPIIFWASFITLFTSYFYPSGKVLFGILHLMTFLSLLLLPFLHYPKVALLSALLIFLSYTFSLMPFETIPPLSMVGPTMDFEPIYPWAFFGFLGVFLASIIKKIECENAWCERSITLLRKKSGIQKLIKISSHSLLIYILHRPIVFLVAFILSKF